MINAKYFEAAQEQLSRRRMNNKLIEQSRRQEVYSKTARYAELEKRLAGTMTGILQIIASRSTNAAQRLEKIKQENLAIQEQMSQELESNGFARDYLEPIYTCPICCDRGTKDGRWCECFNKLVYAAAAKALNEQSPLELSDFESFRLDYYPETDDDTLGQSQRTIMRDNLNDCKDYAESFNGNGKGIFMMGGTGLGKTHLSLAIAKRVMQRGFSAVYSSVPELLRTLEREQFGKSDGDTMSLITACDLLILDDLGAEIGSERNISQLYEIINSRQNRSLPIIANTNLTMQQIKSRYQDRIWSRLFSMRVLIFCGTDNRLKSI